jgi:uncharacterized protein YndB with AHSA1/START domain
MATSSAGRAADEIVSELHIASPPERVFQALVDPDQVPQWWGQAGIYRCTDFQSDLRAGGEWRSAGIGPDGGPFEVSGEYLEVDPPRLLVHTWVASWTGAVKTTVRWELDPTDRGTLLRVRHSGFATHPDVARSYSGWPRMLGWLQAFLENGETVGTRMAASAGA